MPLCGHLLQAGFSRFTWETRTFGSAGAAGEQSRGASAATKATAVTTTTLANTDKKGNEYYENNKQSLKTITELKTSWRPVTLQRTWDVTRKTQSEAPFTCLWGWWHKENVLRCQSYKIIARAIMCSSSYLVMIMNDCVTGYLFSMPVYCYFRGLLPPPKSLREHSTATACQLVHLALTASLDGGLFSRAWEKV